MRVKAKGEDLFDWAFSPNHAEGRLRIRAKAVLDAFNRNKDLIMASFEERQGEVRKQSNKTNLAYATARRKADPAFKLLLTLRGRLNSALRQQSAKKGCKTVKMLGCTVPELMVHLERQFQLGMTWDNHGEWHIDHERPCASFDLTDYAQQRQCFHYSNLKPIWALDNHRKGARWEGKRWAKDRDTTGISGSARIGSASKVIKHDEDGMTGLALPDGPLARTDYRAIWESGGRV